jgi:MoCo/4Fe-4S cofactor protein with predicted Tat translocation signal
MSKRVFNHPKEEAGGRKYWRSLGQLGDTPEFRGWLEREFPQGASELAGGEVSRRAFMRLMGASTALAGLSLAACRRPEKHLVPFTRGVEWSIPGKALFFATAMPTRNGFSPLVATTYDGRPTKIEGNPLHSVSQGASGLYEQASILDLYDPDRATQFKLRGTASSADSFEKGLSEIIANGGDGAGLAFLLEHNNSPTRERLRAEIAGRFPKAMWAVYEPLAGADANEVFGSGVVAAPDFSKADVILAVDSDFLGKESGTSDERAFARRRSLEDGNKMNRLYVAENRYTTTGGMADHRLRIPASQAGAFLLAIAGEISNQTGDASLKAVLSAAPKSGTTFPAEWVKECAADLVAHKGAALVLVGSRQRRAVQALAFAVNAALGGLGKTLVGRPVDQKPSVSIVELAKALAAKQVKTLVIIGGNPAYNAPADLDFAAKVKAAEMVIRVGYYEDETAPLATWHAPLAHYLEAWGDGRASDGTYLSVQPTILPLFGAWSELDVLAKFAGHAKPKGPELVQETFKAVVKPTDFSSAWTKFLRDGFVSEEKPATAALTLAADAVSKLATDGFALPQADAESYEIVLAGDTSVDDGRYANNGWLQEFPDPITKQTWDNAAWISPANAKKLGIEENGEFIEITLEGAKLEIPVLIAPGHADNSLTIPLGYGRTAAGRVGTVASTTEKDVTGPPMISGGFNAYPLTTSAESYIRVGAKVRAVGRSYLIAITQEHGSLEGRGADLVREIKHDQVPAVKANPDLIKKMGMDGHIPENRSLYSHPPLSDIHQWGMTVDLNSCTGCGVCMVSCQAENNIPIVGKRQVIDGREMHWIRCDRYFASGPDAKGNYDQDVTEPELVSQPMMCQQCENAPCETVCPVNATVHSEDGLNVMAYNRCIGTRYCANNCPFKVRRFNFFDYNQRKLTNLRTWNMVNEKGMEETLKLSKNPNVTVRMRGVMEKCTFCVQRIQEAKIATKVAGRGSDKVRIPANSFTVACAQSCPSEAIVFGDISNPESKVSKIFHEDPRAYELLKYLNIGTRVHYLARVRNPNPKMPGADKVAAYIKKPHHGGASQGAEKVHGGAQ